MATEECAAGKCCACFKSLLLYLLRQSEVCAGSAHLSWLPVPACFPNGVAKWPWEWLLRCQLPVLTKACVTLWAIFPVTPLTSSLHCPACGGSWASWPANYSPRQAFSCSELNCGLHWGLISSVFNRIFNLKFGPSLIFLAQVQTVSFNTGSVICGGKWWGRGTWCHVLPDFAPGRQPTVPPPAGVTEPAQPCAGHLHLIQATDGRRAFQSYQFRMFNIIVFSHLSLVECVSRTCRLRLSPPFPNFKPILSQNTEHIPWLPWLFRRGWITEDGPKDL